MYPSRDRRLAAQVRHGPRPAVPVAEVVAAWQRSAEHRQILAAAALSQALDKSLPRHLRTSISVSWEGPGHLILRCGHPALAMEIQNFYLSHLRECLRTRGIIPRRISVRGL